MGGGNQQPLTRLGTLATLSPRERAGISDFYGFAGQSSRGED
jgi:hypothetical protein